MAARWLLSGIGGVILVGLWIGLAPRGPLTIHVSGDLAPDLRAMLALPDTLVEPDPDKARLSVISVTSWDKISFVPGAVDDCGPDCAATSPYRLVRITRLGPTGTRRQVFLNLAPFLDGGDSLRFALSENGRRCLSGGIRVEVLGQIGARDWPDGCLSADRIIARRRFGFH